MIAVWDDLAIWGFYDRRDNNGTVELLLSHEVLVCRTGASENESVESLNQWCGTNSVGNR